MKDLTDVLYYDYVLHKLAHLYTQDDKSDSIIQYQKIAQKLLTKLRCDGVVFDVEIGLKFTYIKLYSLHLSFQKCAGRNSVSCCQSHFSEFLMTCYDYLSKILVEHSVLEDCELFARLFDLITFLSVFSFQTLNHLDSADWEWGDVLSPRACLCKKGINVEAEDFFSREKAKFMKSSGIKTKDEEGFVDEGFECVMEEFRKVLLSFNTPVLEFFSTKEVIRLKEIYPEAFKVISGVPKSGDAYKREIIEDYLSLRASLDKTRSAVVRQKGKKKI